MLMLRGGEELEHGAAAAAAGIRQLLAAGG